MIIPITIYIDIFAERIRKIFVEIIMENSMGFMAVFAVSGGVVLLARQAHRRLLSEFMKKIEFELGGSNKSCHQNQVKKKVRFADDVIDPSSNNKKYRKKYLTKSVNGNNNNNNNMNNGDKWKCMDSMPVNRQILYKGIMEYKILKGLA
ncbi:uncharacterized protein LOC110806385 [Carica papaya]|uniref:uncharacterized protein LOC110806385 n=1 Tax=Carica papaya TaxID=3649 RepID=UPI000B8CAD8C|nr:uncharacterized protein LOC110806385 [Carica papaya]